MKLEELIRQQAEEYLENSHAACNGVRAHRRHLAAGRTSSPYQPGQEAQSAS